MHSFLCKMGQGINYFVYIYIVEFSTILLKFQNRKLVNSRGSKRSGDDIGATRWVQ